MKPLSLDLQTLRARFRSGRLTPVELIREIHRRIAARGNDAVWIHLIPQAEVEARADGLGGFDEARPLYGVPFAVKDNIDVEGLPTTAACPEFSYIAQTTAPVVQRLLDAGGILIGKTNLDQFATGLVGVRSPYGAPSSVFDSRYISGGSSSGSAVAVAAGLVSFSIGTDTAGSGRVPAAFNNIIGWKPTRGLVSTRGIVPACRSLDCPSIFTLTAPDAAEVAHLVSAFDRADPYSRRPPSSRSPLPESFHFGVPREEELSFFGDDEARALFCQAKERLKSLGGRAVEVDFAPFREAADLLYSGPWVAERLAALTPFIDERPEALHPVTLKIIEGARRFTAVETFRAFYELETLRRRAEGEWEQMDLLLLPTTGTIYTHAEVDADPVGLNTHLGFYTNFVNLLDLCGIAVPAGFRSNGLPFGVTLLGPAFQDSELTALADRYHRNLGGRLGGTETTIDLLQPNSIRKEPQPTPTTFPLAVVGAHLRGEPLNSQLVELGARFERSARTAPGYRLFSLPETVPPKPGLVCDPDARGPGIEVEVWLLDATAFGRFVGSVRAPLCIGTIELEDGRKISGFLCESFALTAAEEITQYGGWRNFKAATLNSPPTDAPLLDHS